MVEFKHILCPVDLSETSIRALTYAAALATWYEAQLEVLHVLPVPDRPALSRELDASTGVTQAAARDLVAAELRRTVQSVDAAGITPAIVLEQGRPDQLIALRAGEHPAGLLVMGTHGRSGFNRLLLGSVTEKVLRTVRCPVLTGPPAAAAMPAKAVAFKRILCAMDYSPSALMALRYALDLGRQAGGCVVVLYALEYMSRPASTSTSTSAAGGSTSSTTHGRACTRSSRASRRRGAK